MYLGEASAGFFIENPAVRARDFVGIIEADLGAGLRTSEFLGRSWLSRWLTSEETLVLLHWDAGAGFSRVENLAFRAPQFALNLVKAHASLFIEIPALAWARKIAKRVVETFLLPVVIALEFLSWRWQT